MRNDKTAGPQARACGRRGAAAALLAAALLAPAGACAQAPGRPPHGDRAGSVVVEGVTRTFRLRLPPAYADGRPVPLVVVLHGGGGSGRRMSRHIGMGPIADREGFAVVYPDGIGGSWNDGRGIAGRGSDDVGFIRTLLDTLSRRLRLDTTRIYATGISNGAMFAHRLACDLPGRFAAIAPVAGGLPASLADRCAGTPVSVLAIQGTADRLVPYDGGMVAGSRGEVLSAAASVAHWARVAGCAPAPVTAPLPDRAPRDGTTIRHTEYRGCRGHAVSLYTVTGGGHTWPGGEATSVRLMGRTTRDIGGSREIWRFFAAHPRP